MDLNNRNTELVERKNKSDISQNRRNWDHIRIIQKIPEQYIAKARYQGITERKGHIGSLHPASENIFLQEYKTFIVESTINCNNRMATTLCTPETLFFAGI
jgi:hypothetical protein